MASLSDAELDGMSDREILLHLAREYREIRVMVESVRDGASGLMEKIKANPMLRGLVGG